MKNLFISLVVASGIAGSAFAQEPVWDANTVVLESQKISDGIYAVIPVGADSMAKNGLPIATSGGFGYIYQRREPRLQTCAIGRGAGQRRDRELHGTSEVIEAFLKRHLSDEEELAVPIILHHRLRG